MFWLVWLKFNILKGDWALCYVSTQIWDCSYIFLFPNILSLKSFGTWRGMLDTKLAILDIMFHFTCGQSGLCWKIVKFQNIMTMIIRKISFWSLHLQQWFQFLEKTIITGKKVSSAKKPAISDGESFLESIFDLNWICKILPTQNR